MGPRFCRAYQPSIKIESLHSSLHWLFDPVDGICGLGKGQGSSCNRLLICRDLHCLWSTIGNCDRRRTTLCVLKGRGLVLEVFYSTSNNISISSTSQWKDGKNEQGDWVNPYRNIEESSQGLGWKHSRSIMGLLYNIVQHYIFLPIWNGVQKEWCLSYWIWN